VSSCSALHTVVSTFMRNMAQYQRSYLQFVHTPENKGMSWSWVEKRINSFTCYVPGLPGHQQPQGSVGDDPARLLLPHTWRLHLPALQQQEVLHRHHRSEAPGEKVSLDSQSMLHRGKVLGNIHYCIVRMVVAVPVFCWFYSLRSLR